jgi:hypothetical protein
MGVDAMINVIAARVTTAGTNPLLNAWYDANGLQNSDKCTWAFGSVLTAGNGARYNFCGTNNFCALLQRNWDRVRGVCA